MCFSVTLYVQYIACLVLYKYQTLLNGVPYMSKNFFLNFACTRVYEVQFVCLIPCNHSVVHWNTLNKAENRLF